MVTHVCGPKMQGTEAGGLLRIPDYSVQRYRVKPCLKENSDDGIIVVIVPWVTPVNLECGYQKSLGIFSVNGWLSGYTNMQVPIYNILQASKVSYLKSCIY